MCGGATDACCKSRPIIGSQPHEFKIASCHIVPLDWLVLSVHCGGAIRFWCIGFLFALNICLSLCRLPSQAKHVRGYANCWQFHCMKLPCECRAIASVKCPPILYRCCMELPRTSNWAIVAHETSPSTRIKLGSGVPWVMQIGDLSSRRHMIRPCNLPALGHDLLTWRFSWTSQSPSAAVLHSGCRPERYVAGARDVPWVGT